MNNVKPDLVVVQPVHFDAPGFRQQVRRYRDYFNKVILVWSQHHLKVDISTWMEDIMQEDEITFIPWQVTQSHLSPDWGQRAIHTGLMQVTSSHVLISQQDFLVHNDKLFDIIFEKDFSLISHYGYNGANYLNVNPRFEPDFIYMAMDKLRQTSMDCSADPPLCDYWSHLSDELRLVCPDLKTLEDLGLRSPVDWEHLQGLFIGYRFLQLGMTESIRNPEGFSAYNKSILHLPTHPDCAPWIEKAAHLR